jgi:hypothetical protein
MMAKRLAKSSTVVAVSFPVHASAEEDMVGKPGQSDTRLSQVGD